MSSIRLVADFPAEQRLWRNDPAMMRWCRQQLPISKEAQERWKEGLAKDTTVKMFGVQVIKDDGTEGHIVGTCGLTSIRKDHGTAEFSLFIGPPYQRTGYGKKALIELLKVGFHAMRLHLIWGEVLEGNHALALFTQIGMKNEGILRDRYFKEGRYHSSYMVSITEEEFGRRFHRVRALRSAR